MSVNTKILNNFLKNIVDRNIYSGNLHHVNNDTSYKKEMKMFNLQNASQSPITMSSRDIAELTGKTLSHVNRDIFNMLEELHPEINPKMDDYDFIGVFVEKVSYNGRSIVKEILLNKEHTECLITGYSATLRMKVIKRLHELEQQQQENKLPTDYLSALKALTAEVEERQKLEQTLSIAAPKAQFVDSYVESEGSFGFREVAKILGVGEKILRSYLLDNDIMYRLKGNLTGRAYHINMGRFITKTGTNESGNAFSQTKFTPKGVYWIAKKMNIDVDKLPEAV